MLRRWISVAGCVRPGSTETSTRPGVVAGVEALVACTPTAIAANSETPMIPAITPRRDPAPVPCCTWVRSVVSMSAPIIRGAGGAARTESAVGPSIGDQGGSRSAQATQGLTAPC